MASQKLLVKKFKKIKRWNWGKTEIKRLIKLTPNITKRQKTKHPKIKIKSDRIRKVPEILDSRHLLRPHFWWKRYFCRARLRYRLRKNQKNLSSLEWARFIYAIEAIADSDTPMPNFQDYVQIHIQAMTTATGNSWGAHGGNNFLTWHREYLVKLEARLLAINPLVTIPYWNWIEDRAIPNQLNNASDLTRWGITRNSSFNGSPIATTSQYNNLMSITNFNAFSSTLESSPFHDLIHGLVGGTMSTAASPADPIFWLHHCFIDKVFADWQSLNPTVNHPSPNTVLKPSPLMTRTNAQVWKIRRLRYIYQP